jgi:hypothetical protein
MKVSLNTDNLNQIVHTVATIHANVILTTVRDFPLVMEMPVRTENQPIAFVKKLIEYIFYFF